MFVAVSKFIERFYNICLEMIGYLTSTTGICKYERFQVIQDSTLLMTWEI